MKVGIDYRPATVAPWSGVGRQVRALESALLARQDIELQRYSAAPLGHPQRDSAFCPVWDSSLDGLHRPQERWRFEARFLPRVLRQNAPDIYIATLNMGLPFGCRNGETRYVLLLHDIFQLTEKNHHRSALQRITYGLTDALSIAWSVYRADQIWCPSQFTIDCAGRYFPWARGKFRCLPNLVEGTTARNERLGKDELPDAYWLLVGTREPRKNLQYFLRVWSGLRQQGYLLPDLVLLGDPPLDLEPLLAKQPGVHWIAQVGEAQLHRLYQQADCLWQPSFAEGFGLPVVEACAAGTPVAVARGSALDEVAPPAAPRFEPRHSADLEACMLKMSRSAYPLSSSELRCWAAGFATQPYRHRLNQLLAEL